MPDVLFEEDDEQRADREAEEERDALFRQRLMAASERARLERQKQVEEIRRAEAILQNADPMLRAEERYRKAIEGCDLRAQVASPPSVGGLPPGQAEEVARKQAAAERQWQEEQRIRKRWVENQEEALRNLTAGQEPSQQASIRSQIKSQGGN